MKTILITGSSGFIGSHITEGLINSGYKIVALKREASNLWRCNDYNNQIQWVNCDNLVSAESEIINSNPEILIHAAWNGVKEKDRDNWSEQEKNLTFLVQLFEIVKKTSISKIIALGSQAEYGKFEGRIDEKHTCNPNTAYGATKLSSSILLKSFAQQNEIDWYWLRIFSVYGPKEENNWLIPATIKNLIENKEMSLTPCEQLYDYIYIKDLVAGILSIVNIERNISGIYNFSSGQCSKIKNILSYLENTLAPQKRLLHIGKLPYRLNQVMHMEGNSNLFFTRFNFGISYSITEGLNETIKYYLNEKVNDTQISIF